MKVTFDCRIDLWQMFVHQFGSQAGPCGVMAVIDGFDPRDRYRAARGGVKKSNVIRF